MESHKVIRRSELHRLVWTEPASKVAKSFGISDVGLAKLCKRHDIPKPSRGYWAQLQYGQKVKQIELPKPEDDSEIAIVDRLPFGDITEDVSAAAAVQTPTEPAKIVVSDSLRGCHELVQKTNQELVGIKADADGMISSGTQVTLQLRTSKSCARRALLIYDALLKECERRGYQVAAGPRITVLNHTMSVGISELVDTVREETKDDDLQGSYVFGHSRYNSKRVPSGKLSLRVENGLGYWANGRRCTWSDTERTKLDDRLDKALLNMVETAVLAQKHREEEERQRELRRQEEQRRQEAAHQRAERQKLYKAEKARFKQLLTQAESLQKSRLVRELIEAVKRGMAERGSTPHNKNTEEWIEWATQQADRLDPLLPSPPSILDEVDLEDPPPQQSRPQWGSANPRAEY